LQQVSCWASAPPSPAIRAPIRRRGQDAATQAKQNPGSEADERRDRDSTQQGKTIPGPGAGKHPSDSADTTGAAVKSQESTGTGATGNAGESTDKMRNRDSSKQQDPNSPPKQ